MPSISITKGRGSLNHNMRKFKTQNVDAERSVLNRTLVDLDLQQVYHELFDTALHRYNRKQKRADRRIDNYLQHVRHSKKEKAFHELVVQIGDMEYAQNHDQNHLANMLQEYLEDFVKRNPQMHVFSAVIHMDEATPHLHLDYVPFIHGQKRGLDTRVSNNKAIEQMGHTDWNAWRTNEINALKNVLHRHGLEYTNMHNDEQHLSVDAYKRMHRAVDQQIQQLDSTTPKVPNLKCYKTMRGTEVFKKEELDPVLQPILKRNQLLEKKVTMLEKQIDEMNNKDYRQENQMLKQVIDELKPKGVGDAIKDAKIKQQEREIDRLNKLIAQLIKSVNMLKNCIKSIMTVLYDSFDISYKELDKELWNEDQDASILLDKAKHVGGEVIAYVW